MILELLNSKKESLGFDILSHERKDVDATSYTEDFELSFTNFGTMYLTTAVKHSLYSIGCRYISKNGGRVSDRHLTRLDNPQSIHEFFSFIVEVRIGGDGRGTH